jgi:formate hydrogenlyase transcriptional activator
MDLHPGLQQRHKRTTKRQESEAISRALQENQDWYQDLMEHSHDLLCIHDLEGRLLAVNPASARVLGYSVEKLLRTSMRELIAPEFRPEFDSYLSQIADAGESHGLMTLVTRSGERRIWEYHNTLRTEGVATPIVRGTAHDVTAQKRSEKQLQASHDRYRAVHDRAPVGISWIETATGRFLGVNPKYREIVGRSERDLLGRTFQSITHPDDLAVSLEKLRQLAAGEVRNYEMEKRYLRPDGSVRWAKVKVAAMWHAGEKPVWHLAIVQDVTERKRAEERLREYERVVEGSEEMIAVVDRDYRYVIANRAFLERRNMQKEQLLGRRVGEVVSPEVFEKVVKPKVDECFGGKVVQYEMKYKYPELGERDLFITYFPIEGTSGVDRIVSILRDITDRKHAEQALTQREENYRMFISQSSEGIFREDFDAPLAIDMSEDEMAYRILHDSYMGECNDALAKMYGFASERDLTGKRFSEMVRRKDPRKIELAREYIRSGFRILDRESHEVDAHGNPRIFLNSMIGIVEGGKLVCTWGIQRDVTEKVKLEASREDAEEALRQNVARLQAVSEELRLAKEKLNEEKIYLEQAIDTELGFGEIIGQSSALKEVMHDVARVACSDATVLVLGETGTGKELVARAIHRSSNRKENSFIKLNCAAIPTGLLESELFGHEKGAFTGAINKKVGRLELADQGTLFLDEIGEIPLELQPKLLRVLQDHEFERLGGTQTLKVNFRLVAATNRDLRLAVNQREFRSDLYYRLNVFPINTPPLRDRRGDIPLLAEHFVRKYAERMGKTITSIPAKSMETLVQWSWPGNIRELENFMERSVILTPGKVLQAPFSELSLTASEGRSETLRERERERIVRALRECKGRLGGPSGAAARLGLKRTTLQSKLSQLEIDPRGFRG